jgi:hypothetical protein
VLRRILLWGPKDQSTPGERRACTDAFFDNLRLQDKACPPLSLAFITWTRLTVQRMTVCCLQLSLAVFFSSAGTHWSLSDLCFWTYSESCVRREKWKHASTYRLVAATTFYRISAADPCYGHCGQDGPIILQRGISGSTFREPRYGECDAEAQYPLHRQVVAPYRQLARCGFTSLHAKTKT